jgi:hypothetical protein
MTKSKIEMRPGDVIGSFTIISEEPQTVHLPNRDKKYRCMCTCGRMSIINGRYLAYSQATKCRLCHRDSLCTYKEKSGRNKS